MPFPWKRWRRDLVAAAIGSCLTVLVLVPVSWASARQQALESRRDLLAAAAGAYFQNLEGGQPEAEIRQIASDAVAPELPIGAFVLIDRKAQAYEPGDIVAFVDGENHYVGRVVAPDRPTGNLKV